MKIVTVSREFASGGRELGKRLADELGFNYYDKEIISEIANTTDLSEEYVSKVFDKGLSAYPLHFGISFTGLSVVNQNSIDILIAQQKVIKSIAKRGDCVIVGRSAETILAELNPFKVFVYADNDYKIARCRQYGGVEDLSDKDILKHIKQIDQGRAKNHALISDVNWGVKSAYNLCINTSGFEIKQLVPDVANIAKSWFENQNK